MKIQFGNGRKNGNKLNMVIARTHRLSTRLVGMQLTSGNLFGILLSMLQMSLGFEIVSRPATKGVWYMVVAVFVIGCMLGLLIERLSIGGLATVRESSEGKRKVLEDFYKLSERGEPSSWAIENKERKVQGYNRDIWVGWSFGALGMLLSTSIGDVFWHSLFAPMDSWVEYPLSFGCACVIGLTFVHSELFKSLLDRVLRAILQDMHLMQVAVATEKNNMQLDMAASAMDSVRNDEAVRDPIEAKMAKVVVKSLSNFSDGISPVEIEGSVSDVPQLPSGSQRGQYYQYKEELRRLLAADPNMSIGDLAKHFGKSKSTVADWKNKYRAGL
jgi:hypothetical protein